MFICVSIGTHMPQWGSEANQGCQSSPSTLFEATLCCLLLCAPSLQCLCSCLTSNGIYIDIDIYIYIPHCYSAPYPDRFLPGEIMCGKPFSLKTDNHAQDKVLD